MDITAIITTSISAVATVVMTVSNLWLNSQRRKDKYEAQKRAEKNAAKSSIMDLMTQDIIRVEILHKNPENHKALLEEFDKYVKSGGNSYVKEKVEAYINWYETKVEKNGK